MLTDATIKALKPKDKPYKVGDSGGLYLAILPSGGKSWRIKYYFEGNQKVLTLGLYPTISLAQARKHLATLKEDITHGIDPAEEKKRKKQTEKQEALLSSITFGDLVAAWYDEASIGWSQVHKDDQQQKINAHILPYIGSRPLAVLCNADIALVFEKLNTKKPTLKKVRSILSQVLRFIMEKKEAEKHSSPDQSIYKDIQIQDWTILHRNKTKGHEVKHRACLYKEDDIARLMQGIASYHEISLQTAIALEFSALTFCRPTEIRHAEWAEIDWGGKQWVIPAHKMKAKKTHVVPLASRTMELLGELKPLTGDSQYLFPNFRSKRQPMSEACILAAIRAMGFTKDDMSAHGFRGMASTVLNSKKQFDRDLIEVQLAHVPDNKVRGAYNHTTWLELRTEMMQWWSDYLCELQKRK